MKVDVYCLCKNEEYLAPFMIDYWQSLADDVNVYVYDGYSTDNTCEILEKYDWIHVIKSDVNKIADEYNYAILKNTCWKQSIGKTDFVMVCDFDETIFAYNKNIKDELQYMKDNGFSILLPLSFNIVCDNIPEYKQNYYLHELCKTGFNDTIGETKAIFFDPNLIDDINYVPGAHVVYPTGHVKYYGSNNLFLIHCKYIGIEKYIKKVTTRKSSLRSIENNLGTEGLNSNNALQNTFILNKQKSFEWKDIPYNFNVYYNKRIDWTRWGIYFEYNDKNKEFTIIKRLYSYETFLPQNITLDNNENTL